MADARDLLPGLAGHVGADETLAAAALLPLRWRDGSLECLFAQSEVLNTVMSSSSKLEFHRWPGELRFIGGPKVHGHVLPLETLQEELNLLGFRVSYPPMRLMLFRKAVFTVGDRRFRVYVFVVWADGE
jgi:hypothetical protein